jgi:putative transposase
VIRVAFALDTCDREVMARCASTDGISGEMIRDLMLEAVEKRFGGARTPQPIQWHGRGVDLPAFFGPMLILG